MFLIDPAGVQRAQIACHDAAQFLGQALGQRKPRWVAQAPSGADHHLRSLQGEGHRLKLDGLRRGRLAPLNAGIFHQPGAPRLAEGCR